MEMRMWAALRTPMGPKADFEFRPQDLKGQFSNLLTYLYNHANWRAAVIGRQTQCNSYFQFGSPVGNIFLPPPPLQAWCCLWELGWRDLLFFPGANTTKDFYAIIRLYWSGCEVSLPISRSEQAQRESLTAAPSAPGLHRGPAASLPGFPPKRWKGLGAIHNWWLFSAAPALAIKSVTYVLVRLCNIAQSPCLWAPPQEHPSSADLLSATAHCAAPPHCLHNSRVGFLTPLAFKTKYYYLCLLVCLLMNRFKKVMDYISYLAVRGREGGGYDSFRGRSLLVHPWPPSACPGLLEPSQFDLFSHRALGLGQGIQGLYSLYLSSCKWIFKLQYKIHKGKRRDR